ncbi:MAG: tetratricopeptide repeat protein [Gemmatimonadales bacterium]
MRSRALLALLLLGGCAYYNGMYNAKRLAHSAQRAERDGRSIEAVSLWGQVAVKAESVVVQHPRSKWVPEARLLRGKALQRMGDCRNALRELEQVAFAGGPSAMTDEAMFLLGGCREKIGDAAGARDAFGRLAATKDPVRRRQALFLHGRALRLDGRYLEALAELEATEDSGVAGERLAALAGLGRFPEALALADALIAKGDTLAPWDSALASLGRQDLAVASSLVDRLQSMPGASKQRQAGWLLRDGARLAGSQPDRAAGRFTQVEQVAQGSPLEMDARLAGLRLGLARAGNSADLGELESQLDLLSRSDGSAAGTASQLAGAVGRLRTALDSVPPGAPEGDLRLFFAAELARDTVGVPRVAAALFRRAAVDWPGSPFAPKALLALTLLQPDQADSLWSWLRDRYADSPYLAMAQGVDAPRYRDLEDSLQRYDARARVEARRPPPGRPQGRPTPGVRRPTGELQ